jgi:hypothetical protein
MKPRRCCGVPWARGVAEEGRRLEAHLATMDMKVLGLVYCLTDFRTELNFVCPYVGPLCAVCSEGYAYRSSTQQCESCSTSSDSIGFGALFVVICLLLVCVAGWHYLPRIKVLGRAIEDMDDLCLVVCLKIGFLTTNDDSSSYDSLKLQAQALWRRVTSRIKIDVTLWQIATILPFALDLQFPDVYASVVSTFSVLGLGVNIFSIVSCSSTKSNAIYTFVFDTCLPLILVTLFWIIYALHVAVASSARPDPTEKATRSLRSQYFSAFKIYTFLILPQRTAQIFSVFSCKDVDPDGVNEGDDSYMTTDYSVSCSSPTYQFGRAWAIAMVFVYPIGIPLFYSFILYRSRQDIQSHHDASLSREQLEQLSQRTKPIQSLFLSYKPHFWYWEVVETISSLILTGVLLLIAQGSAIQIVIGEIFASIIMLLHNYCEPYIDPNLQRAKHISHWQILGLFFAALLLKADFGSIRRSTLGIFLILMLLYGMAADICLLIWHSPLMKRPSSDIPGLSCEDTPSNRQTEGVSVRMSQGGNVRMSHGGSVRMSQGGSVRMSQGGPIELVGCDRLDQLVEGERGSRINIPSPLHDERL